jgi:putative SOS response-associated peptidase YedK
MTTFYSNSLFIASWYYYFRLKDGSPFAFAGIWDEWRQEGVVIPTGAIITTRPNKLVRLVHDLICTNSVKLDS